MNFASWPFVGIFLPLVIVAHLALRGPDQMSRRLALLIAASAAFYIWSGPLNALVLAVSMAVNFTIGGTLTRLPGDQASRRKVLLWTGVFANAGLLLGFKIAALDTGNGEGFRVEQAILIPLALSFITFQQLGFLASCYRRQIRAVSLRTYAFFLLFFPQLVMGPIVRYEDMERQVEGGALAVARPADLAAGIALFSFALAKKVLLADTLAPRVDAVFAAAQLQPLGMGETWFGLLGFQLQLFLDFSAYAEMAIALGLMFSVRLPLNFDRPLFATDRFDVWRRWHISFAVFMRTNVFFPLVRHWRFSTPAALAVTGILSGLWHGLGWTFVIWGVLQCVILLAVHARNQRRRAQGREPGSLGRIVAIAGTFVTSALIGGLFRSQTLEAAGHIYGGLFSPVLAAPATSVTAGSLLILLGCAVFIWGLPDTSQWFARIWNPIDQRAGPPPLPEHPVARRFGFAFTRGWAIVTALLLVAALVQMEGTRFVYVQF